MLLDLRSLVESAAAETVDAATLPAITQLSESYRNVRNASLYGRDQSVDLHGFFDFRVVPWSIPADRMGARLSGRADTNLDLSWLTALGSYDPAIAAWTIDSQFVARAKYWTAPWTSIDWCTATLPAAPFDAALFPGIAELVGWRTPNGTILALPLGGFVYDLSWVHDVIPLTDPVTGTVIHIRPIAPIMNRRRHRRRR
jgi:hypothetical protein